MGKKIVLIIFCLMFILHQDYWNWNNRELVFGFIPVTLAYHAGFSLCAVTLWAFAVKFAWPSEVEAWADELDGDTEQPESTAIIGGDK
ncbi:MAG: hypothetical protein AB8C95_12200 [Phycisphaeraceae bacterium]